MRALLGLIMAIGLCSGGFCVAAQELIGVEMFPLEQLKPGLKGVGYTVIRGIEPEQFDVEVLELIPDGGFDGGPMILARFTGEVIDFSNGIAGGYSGSPVYIEGKLLGAVSMAIPFTDTHIGGITPIQNMLVALPDGEEIDYSTNTVLPPAEDSGIPLDEEGNVISYVMDSGEALAFNERMRAAGVHRFAAVLARTPVLFSGLSPQVLAEFGPRLEELFGPHFQLADRPMGKAGDYGLFLQDEGDSAGLFLAGGEKAPPLAPGDAVTVSFLQGDVEIYTFGTVTYSDQDGRFLMFGHPMMMQGDANFPIGKGYVTWTFGSIIRAFKDGVRLSNLGNLGTLTKDRGAACGGSFKQEPDLIPVRVKIKDADTGVSQTSRFKVIRHPDFTPILIAIGMTSVAWEVLDRQPTGTMEMSYHIKGEGLEEPLTRGNYYTDDFNVISNGAYDLLPISSLLETNIYREVKVTEISIMVEITRNRINASIDDAEIIWEPEEDEEDDEAGGSTEEDEDGEDEGSEEEDSNDHASAAGSRSASPLQDEEPSPEEDGPMMGPFGMYGMGGGFGEDMPTFAPGETIRVKVQLQPYRTDAVWREFSIEVPEDFPSGSTMIKVHGGGDLISFSELGGKGRNLFGMGPYIDAEEHDLDSILEQIIEWPLNNELLVTLIRPYDPSASTELGKEKDEEQPDNKVDAPYQMEWVIYNGFMLPVNILSLEDEAKMKEMQEMAEGGGEGEDAGDEDGEYETNLPFMVTLPSLAPRGLGL